MIPERPWNPPARQGNSPALHSGGQRSGADATWFPYVLNHSINMRGSGSQWTYYKNLLLTGNDVATATPATPPRQSPDTMQFMTFRLAEQDIGRIGSKLEEWLKHIMAQLPSFRLKRWQGKSAFL